MSDIAKFKPTREEVIFSNVADARRVNRRLRDFGVLSRVVGRKLWIEVTKHGAERDRALALRIHAGEV